MKLTSFLLLISLIQVSAVTYSQATKLSLNFDNVKLFEVLDQIEKTSDYRFFYDSQSIDLSKRVSLNKQNSDLKGILNEVLGPDLVYEMINNNIVIIKSAATKVGKISVNQQQPLTVSGRVTDSFGSPLPGVTVVVKGTTKGTITNLDGNYSLDGVPGDAVLIFSFVGMKTSETQVAGKSMIDLVMQEEAIGLDEVVAIGYGVQKKKLVTGATVQVKGEELARMVTPNVIDAMKGQTPGVSISSASAQPGETPRIVIRGIGTVNGAGPLFIVDGVQTGNISFLNSNDIESIDVLKDAASAAIYGVNGANGVVLVTTKTGKSGKAQVSYDGYTGVQNLYKKMPYLNSQEYAVIMNEQNINSGQAPVFPIDAAAMAALGKGTDWVDELVSKDALMQNHSLAFSGGTNQSVYSM